MNRERALNAEHRIEQRRRKAAKEFLQNSSRVKGFKPPVLICSSRLVSLNRRVYARERCADKPAFNAVTHIMNKRDIAVILRTEVGALEDLIKKLKARSDRLKKMLFELEEEIDGPAAQKEIKMLGSDSKFRKMVDRVFGETLKPPKR
jgi:hypothetical protein